MSAENKLHPKFEPYEALVEAGYLSRNESGPDLILYNYTDKCTYEKYWNVYTLSARGTIYNRHTGEVVARAFDKFFNIGELEKGIDDLPSLPFTAAEKVDGSLGILYYDKEWRVATRGSFTSEQALWATQHLFTAPYNMDRWPKDWTPLVEIIYPENRIIVDYGQTKDLVLLAARHIKTGVYMSESDLNRLGSDCGFSVRGSSEMNLDEMLEEAKTMGHNHEGWVLTYSNGFMVKIKGAKYLELARFKAHLNPLHMWEKFVDGTIDNFMTSVPEEFREEAQDMYDRLKSQFKEVKAVLSYYTNFLGLANLDTKNKELMKKKAQKIKTQDAWMHGYLFQFMRGGNSDILIWKLLRPTGGKYVSLAFLHS